MNQLFFVLGGWFGLLSRGSMLLQLLLAAGLLVGYRLWMVRYPRWRTPRLMVLAKLMVVALLALLGSLLPALGMPGGVLLLLAQILLVFTGLQALRLLLRRWLDPLALDGYWQRAVWPLFAVLTLVGLVQRLDGLEQIGAVPLLRIFDQNLFLSNLLLLVTLPYFLVVLSELPVLLIGELLGRLMGMGPANRKALELILRYLLIGLGVVWLADRIGLNGTTIAAIAGGLSVGLGFGVKEVFSNFVSGLWLLFEGSVRPGDVLVVDGDVCEVRKLGLRATTLWRDTDNAELVVPNQNFFTATATTYTGSDERRRSQVLVGTDYRHDPEEVISLLEGVARAHPRVLPEPPPRTFLLRYGDSSIDYALYYWIADPMTNISIASEIRRTIWRVFKENGIQIPFPQRVVHQAPSSGTPSANP
jgi:small-conductance mechanosensitive channel